MQSAREALIEVSSKAHEQQPVPLSTALGIHMAVQEHPRIVNQYGLATELDGLSPLPNGLLLHADKWDYIFFPSEFQTLTLMLAYSNLIKNAQDLGVSGDAW